MAKGAVEDHRWRGGVIVGGRGVENSAVACIAWELNEKHYCGREKGSPKRWNESPPPPHQSRFMVKSSMTLHENDDEGDQIRE